LRSDAVIPTFKWHKRIQTLIPEEQLKAFNAAGYTIGGMMIFPGNRIDGKWTINQARGCTGRIGDRFDLTLECIRRHYGSSRSTRALRVRSSKRVIGGSQVPIDVSSRVSAVLYSFHRSDLGQCHERCTTQRAHAPAAV